MFASLAICGATTALQPARFGRLGAGHLAIAGAAPIFLAVCIAALTAAEPTTMARLVAAASLLQFALARWWLPLLRHIATPAVSGTVMMLVAYTIMPVVMGLLDELPDGTSAAAAPCIVGVTLAVAVAMALRASGARQLWSHLTGIATG